MCAQPSAAPALCRAVSCRAVSCCAQPAQASLLAEVDSALRAEYAVRRRMLIERIKARTRAPLGQQQQQQGGGPEVGG